MDEISLLSEERLFTRDIDGHLLRMDKPTAKMLDDSEENLVALTIDGQEIKIPKAVPLTDPEGGIRYDERGLPIPRLTTILDAVSKRYEPGPNPVPVLCHREHLTPAAVCRVCVVQVSKKDPKTLEIQVDPKLSPACHQPISKGMIVDTIAAVEMKDGEKVPTKGAKRVGKTVRLLVEMLAANHLHPVSHPANELQALADDPKLGTPIGPASRFARRPKFATPPATEPTPGDPIRDHSSPWFKIDRSACILCDRCVRSCGEVRGHLVLARAGKGAEARIAFDWGDRMNESSCVRCGECFISCPTNAITMRENVKPSPWEQEESSDGGLRGWLGQFFRPQESDR